MHTISSLFLTTLTVYGFLARTNADIGSENPAGIKLRITQSGLNFAKAELIKIIHEKLQKHLANDNELSTSTTPTSSSLFSYDLSNCRIQNLTFDPISSYIAIKGGKYLALAVRELSAHISADYSLKIGNGWLAVTRKGSLSVAISSYSLGVATSLKSNRGHLSLDLAQCSTHVGNFEVTIKTQTALLNSVLEFFKKSISEVVRGVLNNFMCGRVTEKLIDFEANSKLQGLPLQLPVFESLTVDTSLVADPIIGKTSPQAFGFPTIPVDFIEFQVNGEVSDGQSHIPDAHEPLPEFTDFSDKAVSVEVSEYVFNSAFYSAHHAGILNKTIDKAALKALDPTADLSQLDTDCTPGGAKPCIGMIIPELKTAFPNSSAVIQISSASAPIINLGARRSSLNISLELDLKVVDVNNETRDAFIAQCVAVATLSNVHFSNQTLKGAVKTAAADLWLTSSSIGTIDLSSLAGMWRLLLAGTVDGIANKILEAGLPIPAQYIPIKLVNTAVKIGDNYIAIGMVYFAILLFFTVMVFKWYTKRWSAAQVELEEDNDEDALVPNGKANSEVDDYETKKLK